MAAPIVFAVTPPFQWLGGGAEKQPHQPHFQTTKFNVLNGGIQRHFSPVRNEICNHHVMREILAFGSQVFGVVCPLVDWHVEIHQFRILARESGGKPTPEGMHRDGVDFVPTTFIDRSNVTGGETTIQDLDGNEIAKFTLTDVMETVMLDDLRVAHGVTPIFPASEGRHGHRDILVVTFKRKLPHDQRPFQKTRLGAVRG